MQIFRPFRAKIEKNQLFSKKKATECTIYKKNAYLCCAFRGSNKFIVFKL